MQPNSSGATFYRRLKGEHITSPRSAFASPDVLDLTAPLRNTRFFREQIRESLAIAQLQVSMWATR